MYTDDEKIKVFNELHNLLKPYQIEISEVITLLKLGSSFKLPKNKKVKIVPPPPRRTNIEKVMNITTNKNPVERVLEFAELRRITVSKACEILNFKDRNSVYLSKEYAEYIKQHKDELVDDDNAYPIKKTKSALVIELARDLKISIPQAALRVGVTVTGVYKSKEYFQYIHESRDINPTNKKETSPPSTIKEPIDKRDWFDKMADETKMSRELFIRHIAVSINLILDKNEDYVKTLTKFFPPMYHHLFDIKTLQMAKRQTYEELKKLP